MSAVLVDTHIALWALGDPARLTDRERGVLTDPAVDRCLSLDPPFCPGLEV